VKAAEASKKAALAQKVAQETAVENHLLSEATSELTAEQLARNGETLTTTLSGLRSTAATEETEKTTGAAFNTLKATSDSARNSAIDAKVIADTATITAEENGKMTTALTDSGLSGNARINLENSLTTTKDAEIKKRVDAMTISVTDEITLNYTKELTDDVEAIKARIAKQLADDINAATTAASTLTDAQQATIATEATAKTSTKMADWRAGNLVVKLPDAAAVAAAKLADDMQGLSEDQKTTLNSKVADLVTAQLPAKLTAAVDAKMLTSQNEAVLAVQNQLKAASDTKLEADIAAQSVGKTDAEVTALKSSLETAAQTALDIETTTKTTGTALTGIQTQLRTDLSTQLSPTVKADLEATIMQTELAKAKMAAAQSAVAGGEERELGSALDNAKNFKHSH